MAGEVGQHIITLRNQLAESSQALEEEAGRTAQLKMANEYLVKEVQNGKTAYAKLENHAKECERAVEKAQRSSKHDKSSAESTVKIQRVHLKTAEQKVEDTQRALDEWRRKYGWSVDLPAQEKLALQAALAESRSRAEKAQIQIASLEEQIQGTPDRVGLHQALEQWDEHQACSAGFAELEDKIYDGNMIKEKLESDLQTIKQRYQKAKSDIAELQSRVNQLEEARMTSQGFPITSEQVEQAEKAFQELQIKANQLEQDKQALQDQDKTNEYIQRIQKLEFDLNAVTGDRQATDVKMKALQEQNDQLQQANNAFLGQDGSLNEMLQKLDSSLKMEQEQHQTTKLNKETLQEKADQLESNLGAAKEQNETLHSSMEALQGKAGQLESDLRASKEQNETLHSSMEALQGKAGQLESDLRAAKEQNETIISSMDALQGKSDQLKSDLRTANEHDQTAKSCVEALQGKADQLESDLRAQKEHNQKMKSDLEMREDEVDLLRSELIKKDSDDEYPGPGIEVLEAEAEADRLWTENQEKLKSKMRALKAEKDQSDQNLYKLDMEFLEAQKSKQVEEDPEILEDTRRDLEAAKSKPREDFSPEVVEAVRRDIEAEKSKQVENSNLETVEPVWPGNEGSRKLYAQPKSNKDLEQDKKGLHMENETHQASGHSRIAPPMSPIYTTDEGSLDLEKTPRPKQSLRQELGYSSRDQSEIWSSDVSLPHYQGEKTSKTVGSPDVSLPHYQGGKTSKTVGSPDVSLPHYQGGKILKRLGKSNGSLPQFQVGMMLKPLGMAGVNLPQFHGGKLSKPAGKADVSLPKFMGKKTSKQAVKDFWDSDDSDDADELIELPTGRKITKLQSTERRAKTMAARELRAKEQSESIESIFECSPAKAHTIDRRLKALGPGCRLQEAPALVAYELSGIPEDTYKGLVSGQLLATMPPNDANGMGTTLMHSIGTDTADLPTEEVTGPVLPSTEIATDTTDLPNAHSMITETRLSSGSLSEYFIPLLLLLLALLSLILMYMDFTSTPSPKTANGVVYKNAYSLRYMPTPSISAATPVTFVYPPTPAPQLGLMRMLMASSVGRGILGGR